MKNKTYMASRMRRRDEKDIKKIWRRTEGKLPTERPRRGLEGNIKSKSENNNIFALNYASGHEIYGKFGT